MKNFIESTMKTMGLTPRSLAEKMQVELNKIIVFNFNKHKKKIPLMVTSFILLTKGNEPHEKPCLEFYGMDNEGDKFIIETLDFQDDVIKGLMTESQYQTLIDISEMAGFDITEKLGVLYEGIYTNLSDIEADELRDVGVVILHKPERAKILLSYIENEIIPFKEINLTDLIQQDEV